MSYDFYGGSFSNINKLNAPIVDCQSRACGKPFDISSGLQDYLAAGIPADKLVLGLATYGRTYALNTPGGNPEPGTAATTGAYTGVWSWLWSFIGPQHVVTLSVLDICRRCAIGAAFGTYTACWHT